MEATRQRGCAAVNASVSWQGLALWRMIMAAGQTMAPSLKYPLASPSVPSMHLPFVQLDTRTNP